MSTHEDETIHPVARPQCYLCGRPGKTLYRGLSDRLFDAPGTWGFNQCAGNECGLLWLDPSLTKAELARAYQSYYTHASEVPLPAIAFFFFRLFHSWQRFTVLDAERSKLSLMALGDLPPGRLLEIGSGAGQFLARMKSRGWSVIGVDIDEAATETARKKYDVPVRHGSFSDFDFEGGSFDAVCMSHVIEHLLDPMDLLRRCREALKPGGRLVVVTPNVASLGHRRFGRHWRGLEPPRHLILFSERTLRRCAAAAGLRVRSIWTSAANASYVYLASTMLRRGERMGLGLEGQTIARIAGAAWFSLEEFRLNRPEAWLGEELVLEAEK